MAGRRKKQLTGFEKQVIQRTRQARNDKELNQDQISEALGIPRPTYANYETDRTMDMELIPKFCEITGISIEYLLTGKDHPVINAYLAAASDDRRLADKVLNITWEPPKKRAM